MDDVRGVRPAVSELAGVHVRHGWRRPGRGHPDVDGVVGRHHPRHERDGGVAYLRNRYYDAKTGRFTQLDPIGLGGGLNLYGFGSADPVSYSDPFGSCPVPQICAGLLGAAIGAGGRVLFNVVADRPLGEGVGESALAGAIAGLTFGAAAPEATAAFFARTAASAAGGAGAAATGRVMLEAGKQGKHIPGHNTFINGRSIFTHADPQGLLDKFAGTGQRISGVAGGPGKELVDFGQVIGQAMVDEKLVNTTQGIIHYSNTGAHIVPRIPQ
jgi:RHS repeat-associated protein